jgi:hypothetical protein
MDVDTEIYTYALTSPSYILHFDHRSIPRATQDSRQFTLYRKDLQVNNHLIGILPDYNTTFGVFTPQEMRRLGLKHYTLKQWFDRWTSDFSQILVSVAPGVSRQSLPEQIYTVVMDDRLYGIYNQTEPISPYYQYPTLLNVPSGRTSNVIVYGYQPSEHRGKDAHGTGALKWKTKILGYVEVSPKFAEKLMEIQIGGCQPDDTCTLNIFVHEG